MSDRNLPLRRIPYPYRSMLAVCSDLDETPDADSYFDLMRFLNTTEQTPMGEGVGLEIGNSIYFDMPAEQFSYWNCNDAAREKIRALIRSGHIDCLHSFGDFAATRREAARALEELERHNCRLRVWIDHAVAPNNFGTDRMKGHADEPGHEAYHADLSVAHGIRYVWRGRVTSVIGQDRRFSLRGIADLRHPHRSADTLLREYAKHVTGRFPPRRYALHVRNRTLMPLTLRSGARMYEFLRCNPHWGGVSSCERADGIHEVVTRRFLDRLVERQGACVLYTHLGKARDRRPGFPIGQNAVQAFRLLAEYHRSGKILVTTTRRLLDYVRVRDAIEAKGAGANNDTVLDLHSPHEADSRFAIRAADDLAGVTIYSTIVPHEVRLNGAAMENPAKNAPDETGRSSVSFPWRGLSFPEL